MQYIVFKEKIRADFFLTTFDINFSGRYLESDEGPALKSICEKYSMIQLACVRHFLEKIKKMDYFYEVKQLIKCTSDFDFQNYIQQFSNQFSQICIEKPVEFTKINKILQKVGLIFLMTKYQLKMKPNGKKFLYYIEYQRKCQVQLTP